MLDENEVTEAVAAHLSQKGFRIIQKLNTTQKGTDLIVTNDQTDETFFVEVKGGTSTVRSSNRFGKPYTQSQVLDRVSKGFYTAAVLHSGAQGAAKARVALAIPETKHFLRYANDVKPAADELGIRILVVKDDRSVYEL
jgi:Holliday junction resolvase-like predicted endonuclease